MAPPQLIVLRHGQSQWNHENKFCGWIDIPLTDDGRREAAAAGKLIRDAGLLPACVYLSKLSRLIETAQIVAREIGRAWLDDHKLWRLNERHYGQYQGRDKHDVYRLLGDSDAARQQQYQYIRRNIDGCPPLVPSIDDDESMDERYRDVPPDLLPRGESLRMAMDRLLPYLMDVIQREMKQKNRLVLVVTHGLIVRGLIKSLCHVSDEDISQINVPNAVPLVFQWDEEKQEIGSKYCYLDQELAARGMEKVRSQGLSKVGV